MAQSVISVGINANNTRVTKVINKEEDLESFQEDLDKLYNWAENNNMTFNGTKFELLRYGYNEDLKNATNYQTPQANDIIEEKETLRDLGVIMYHKANFSDHINKVCSQA